MGQYTYPAKFIRAIDGDTCVFQLAREVEIDFGFRFKTKMTVSFESAFRLAGIDAPELRGKSAKEKKKAQEATEFLRTLLESATAIEVESQKPAGPMDADKYGRWIAVVRITNASGEVKDVAAELLMVGLAVPYDGKGPRTPFQED